MFTPIEAKEPSSIPFFQTSISAGFPSPADDYIERQLDLHEHLVKNPAATFFVRVEGDSMQNAGIFSGDLLVVDRSIESVSGHIVLAILNGEFTVKRLKIRNQKIFLIPENPLYPIIEVPLESDFQVWGVVTYVIHKTS